MDWALEGMLPLGEMQRRFKLALRSTKRWDNLRSTKVEQIAQRRTFRNGPSIDQDERQDDVEQTQCGELIGGAPCDDTAIVVGHVIVIIVVVRAIGKFFFEETFVG